MGAAQGCAELIGLHLALHHSTLVLIASQTLIAPFSAPFAAVSKDRTTGRVERFGWPPLPAFAKIIADRLRHRL